MSKNFSPVNPGLQPFELSHYEGVKGLNYFEMLANLKLCIQKNIPPEHQQKISQHLTGFGFLVSGRLNDLIIAAHQEGKYGYLEKYDRHGQRIDEIIYSPEQLEAKKLAHEAGLVNLDYQPHWDIPFHYIHREALAFISNLNGEGGYNCPLAMTEGMLELLREVADEKQQQRFLPLIVNQELKYHFAAGQYLTERVGGSNVSANRTVATQGENGKWYLLGEKWFCSNPGEVWVTTAKIEGTNTIGAFLVSRFKENGDLNDHHLMRLKDIIGSRGKVTAEVEYRYAEAELIGKASHGLALIIKHVINVSRTHVGLSATAIARRAFWEARAYAATRRAFNVVIDQYSSIQNKLCDMQVRVCAMELAIFLSWQFRQNRNPANEILMPLMKYISTSSAAQITHSAMMIHGGNGILNNYSVLPRLHNDAIINETWEGTHEIISGHVVKALRKPKCRQALVQYLEDILKSLQKDTPLLSFCSQNLQQYLQVDLNHVDEGEYLKLCDYTFDTIALILFLEAYEFKRKEQQSQVEKNDVTIYLLLAEYYKEIKFPQTRFSTADSILQDSNKKNQIIDFS